MFGVFCGRNTKTNFATQVNLTKIHISIAYCKKTYILFVFLCYIFIYFFKVIGSSN